MRRSYAGVYTRHDHMDKGIKVKRYTKGRYFSGRKFSSKHITGGKTMQNKSGLTANVNGFDSF